MHMKRPPSRSTTLHSLLCLLSGSALLSLSAHAQSCTASPTVIFSPAWTRHVLYVHNTSTFMHNDTYANVLSGWQWAQSQILLLDGGAFPPSYDINIYDTTNDSEPDAAGVSYRWPENFNGNCYHHRDSCNICANSTVIYYVDIYLNTDNINAAITYLPPTDTQTITKMVLSHELGHALNLGHTSGNYSLCSDISQSIMQPRIGTLIQCQVTWPTAQCDGLYVTAEYEAPPNDFCETSPDPCQPDADPTCTEY